MQTGGNGLRLHPCPLPEDQVTPVDPRLLQTRSLQGRRLKRPEQAVSPRLGRSHRAGRGSPSVQAQTWAPPSSSTWAPTGGLGGGRRRAQAQCRPGGAPLPAPPGGPSCPRRGFPGVAHGRLRGLEGWCQAPGSARARPQPRARPPRRHTQVIGPREPGAAADGDLDPARPAAPPGRRGSVPRAPHAHFQPWRLWGKSPSVRVGPAGGKASRPLHNPSLGTALDA